MLVGPSNKSKRIRKRTDADRLRQRKERRVKYQKRRAAGRCAYGSCSEKAEAGHSQCRLHLRRMSERALQRRTERIALGLCITCGDRPQFWGRHCILCRKIVSLPYGARRALRLHREQEAMKQKQELRSEVREAVHELLATKRFEGPCAQALALRVGLDNGSWRSYREVGRLMSLSGERVRQILRETKVPLGMSRERFLRRETLIC